ncbi:ribosomal protein L7/L12 [Sphingomonas zeicaulis]|uniref:hypothetical protein n=1 Tax=Sphingomonas zeicaulis TaxID=1632740 RepID=UPI003D218373
MPPRSIPDIASDDLRDFIAAAIIVSDLALPQRYPEAVGLADLQIGYRVHGITGESLVSTKPGAWQPGWIVIAANEFADPFFIDAADATDAFPVHYAPHGAGRWQPVCVAPTLRRFTQILATLRDLEDEDDRALRFIADETDPANPLWREVLQSRRERSALAAEIAGPAPDLADIADHDLVIVDIGPHRLKVVRILRHALGLDMADALALATRPDIAVRRAPRVQLRRLQAELVEAGAAVELRACDPANGD